MTSIPTQLTARALVSLALAVSIIAAFVGIAGHGQLVALIAEVLK